MDTPFPGGTSALAASPSKLSLTTIEMRLYSAAETGHVSEMMFLMDRLIEGLPNGRNVHLKKLEHREASHKRIALARAESGAPLSGRDKRIVLQNERPLYSKRALVALQFAADHLLNMISLGQEISCDPEGISPLALVNRAYRAVASTTEDGALRMNACFALMKVADMTHESSARTLKSRVSEAWLSYRSVARYTQDEVPGETPNMALRRIQLHWEARDRIRNLMKPGRKDFVLPPRVETKEKGYNKKFNNALDQLKKHIASVASSLAKPLPSAPQRGSANMLELKSDIVPAVGLL